MYNLSKWYDTLSWDDKRAYEIDICFRKSNLDNYKKSYDNPKERHEFYGEYRRIPDIIKRTVKGISGDLSKDYPEREYLELSRWYNKTILSKWNILYLLKRNKVKIYIKDDVFNSNNPLTVYGVNIDLDNNIKWPYDWYDITHKLSDKTIWTIGNKIKRDCMNMKDCLSYLPWDFLYWTLPKSDIPKLDIDKSDRPDTLRKIRIY